ncbi:hypothetical protein FACS1894123_01230 [Bacteroidia bacterium]|nr:hypothetical protein FACS1894123_01230 [Bacteroidia bacterium]
MNKTLLKRIERNIFLDILEISDIEFQQIVWLGHCETYISSYVEVMCRLFDDNKFDLFLDEYTQVLDYTSSFQENLQFLKENLDSYNKANNKTDLEILNDPQWNKISKLAKSIINDWPYMAEIVNGIIS